MITTLSLKEQVGVVIGHPGRSEYSAYVDTVAKISPSGQITLQNSGVRFTPKGWGIGVDNPYYRLTTVTEAENVIEEISLHQAEKERIVLEKEKASSEAEKDWVLKSPQIRLIASDSAEAAEATVLRLAAEMGVALAPGSLDVLNYQVEVLVKDYLQGLRYDQLL